MATEKTTSIVIARRANGSRPLEETSERAKRSSSTGAPMVVRSTSPNAGNPVMILALSDQQKMKRFKLDGTWLDTKSFPGSNPRDVVFHRDHLFVHHLGDNWPKDRNAPGYISVLDRDLKVVANLGGSAPRYDAKGRAGKDGAHHAPLSSPAWHGDRSRGQSLHRASFFERNVAAQVCACAEQNQGRQEAQDKTRTWQVSNRSADGGEGTVARPFRTISEAAEVARAGDTVLVKAGVYRERVAPPRSGVTYRVNNWAGFSSGVPRSGSRTGRGTRERSFLQCRTRVCLGETFTSMAVVIRFWSNWHRRPIIEMESRRQRDSRRETQA